jgi:hypothetical protein
MSKSHFNINQYDPVLLLNTFAEAGNQRSTHLLLTPIPWNNPFSEMLLTPLTLQWDLIWDLDVVLTSWTSLCYDWDTYRHVSWSWHCQRTAHVSSSHVLLISCCPWYSCTRPSIALCVVSSQVLSFSSTCHDRDAGQCTSPTSALPAPCRFLTWLT